MERGKVFPSVVLSAGWQDATVVAAKMLTPRSRSITLEVSQWGGNVAGQHVDVRLTAPDGYQAVRSYSVASARPGDVIELAVDRLPDGEVSPYLVDELQLGDRVEVLGPLGGWFVWKPESTQPVQLIAGGSGVVPLMAMMRSRRDAGVDTPFRLLYSVRSPDDVFFAQELAELARQIPMDFVYTRATPAGWKRAPGRITVDDVLDNVFPLETKARTYLCGSTGFVETVSRTLVAVGYSDSDIRTERYGGT